jgi:hypothetical protein
MLEQLTQFLDKNGERDQAIKLLDTMDKLAFTFEENDDVAKSFFKLKEYDKAIKSGLKSYITAYTNEKTWVARANLINIYNHANQPEMALKYIKQAKVSIPRDIDTLLEEAYSNFLMNNRDKAESILLDVLENTDNLSEEYITKIKFNLGTYCLYRDEFQKGLRLFLLEGKKLDYWQKAKLNFNFWEGGIQPGKTIVLYAEAGIGDEIINIRFMKHLRDFGMNPVWLSDRKDLVNIFNRNGFTSINNLKELKNNKDVVWTYPMVLPVYLDLEYKDLWYGPYIKADQNYVEKWSYIKNSPKLKIGIRWQGNPLYDNDLHRSVDLKGFYESLKHLDADFYSLQKDNGLEELEDFPGIIDLQDKLNSWEDTLAVIENLDIVITSCTSVAHASAAMGKKTCIFVPISAYYVWSHSMEQSPWYGDNVILFRQEKPRSWKEPLKKLNKSILDMI